MFGNVYKPIAISVSGIGLRTIDSDRKNQVDWVFRTLKSRNILPPFSLEGRGLFCHDTNALISGAVNSEYFFSRLDALQYLHTFESKWGFIQFDDFNVNFICQMSTENVKKLNALFRAMANTKGNDENNTHKLFQDEVINDQFVIEGFSKPESLQIRAAIYTTAKIYMRENKAISVVTIMYILELPVMGLEEHMGMVGNALAAYAPNNSPVSSNISPACFVTDGMMALAFGLSPSPLASSTENRRSLSRSCHSTLSIFTASRSVSRAEISPNCKTVVSESEEAKLGLPLGEASTF